MVYISLLAVFLVTDLLIKYGCIQNFFFFFSNIEFDKGIRY